MTTGKQMLTKPSKQNIDQSKKTDRNMWMVTSIMLV